MTSAVTTAREALAALLEAAGVPALPYVPEEFPGGVVAIVDGAEDYLTRGETYSSDGDNWLNLTIYVLADLDSNQQATEYVDEALGKVLPALARSAWDYAPAGRPGPFHTANWLAHGAAIPVSTVLSLNTQE